MSSFGNSQQAKFLVRGALALALGLCLSHGAQAQQDPQQQQQPDQSQQPDQAQPPQGQQQPQADQAPPPPPDQQQAPPADSTKPKPKFAPQDADKPPYASDYPAPGPGRAAHAPSPDQYDPDQDLPPGDQNAPAPNGPRYSGPQNGQPGYGQPPYDQNGQPQYAPRPRPRPTAPPPATLTIPAGTVVSVRINEYLSSDRNKVGDRVTATLTQPIIANGWVVARRGQTLTGQVEAAQKAGRVTGTSQLGIELTDITLVDGQQKPILTELWKGSGGTSHGADAATIGGTTALGAAIGAAADWGRGAAIGAGAGAAAGIGAVLLTRGRPTVIAPETPLSFRLVDPVTVDTTQSAQAFYPVGQQDYDNGRGYRGNYASGYAQPGPYAPAPYTCGYYDSCYAYPAYAYPGYAYYPGYYYPYVGFGWGWGWGGRYYGGFGRGFRR
jgi:hypothetical protein